MSHVCFISALICHERSLMLASFLVTDGVLVVAEVFLVEVRSSITLTV